MYKLVEVERVTSVLEFGEKSIVLLSSFDSSSIEHINVVGRSLGVVDWSRVPCVFPAKVVPSS